MRPMVMRWGSANVLTLHETAGSVVMREKGLSASQDDWTWSHNSMHRGTPSLGCSKQDADVKETGEDDIIIQGVSLVRTFSNA